MPTGTWCSAIDNVAAARRNLELSSKLVVDNKAKVEIGTMAPIDVVQAQAEEATRRQALVNAEATRRTNELALKRLIVGGTDDDLWNATIEPTDRPATTPEPIDLEGAVRNALANRVDLAVNKRNLDQNEISVRNLRNATLPDLDLIGNYNLQGRGGTEFQFDRFGGPIIGTIPGGYFDALSTIGRFTAPDLVDAFEPDLPDRPELGGCRICPGARAGDADPGPDQTGRADYRDRSDQRGAERHQQPRGGAGLGRGP